MRKVMGLTILFVIFVSFQALPIISITFDDAFETVFTKAFPIMEKYDIKGTVFITTNNIGKDKYLSKQQLNVLVEYGWSIQAHTVSHPILPLLRINPFQSIIDELYKPKLVLENITKTPIIGFASPYGFYDSWSLAYIKHFYTYHRTTQWGINQFPISNLYKLKTVMPEHCTPLSTLLEYIQKSNDKLLVLTFHDFDNHWRFSYSSEKFFDLIEFIVRHNYKSALIKNIIDN